jgi:hypothetical protein
MHNQQVFGIPNDYYSTQFKLNYQIQDVSFVLLFGSVLVGRILDYTTNVWFFNKYQLFLD